MEKSNICIIGDDSSILLFNAIGVRAFLVSFSNKNQEARKTLIKAIDDNYKLILITDTLADNLQDIIDSYKTEVYPIIFKVSLKDTETSSTENIREIVKKAIGISMDI